MGSSFAVCVKRFDSNKLIFQSLFQSEESNLKEKLFIRKKWIDRKMWIMIYSFVRMLDNQ